MTTPTDGKAPNYDNPSPTRGPLVSGITIGFFIFASLCVALRTYSRKRIIGQMNVDDWFILLAWGFCVPFTVFGIEAVKWGFGRMFSDINPAWYPKWITSSFFFGFFYNPTLMFTKLSILWFYLRLSPYRLFRGLCFASMGVVFFGGIAFCCSVLFFCKPIDAAWKMQAPGTKVECLDIRPITLGIAIFNCISDAIVLVLPIPMVWRLKVSRVKKLAIYALLSLGGFVFGLSCVRIHFVIQGNNIADPNRGPYEGALGASWSVVEVDMGIVCACLPAVRHLYNYTFRGSSASSDLVLGNVNKTGPYANAPPAEDTLVNPPSDSTAQTPRQIERAQNYRNENVDTEALDGETDVESLAPHPSHPQSQENIIPRGSRLDSQSR